MTIESLPPISRIVRFTQIWPLATSAALRLISRPTSIEPVKAMARTSLCRTRKSPAIRPGPVRKFTTPGGIPASSRISKRSSPIIGVSEAGFRTTVLPTTIAAVVMPQRIAHGKFHGGMTAMTPIGRYIRSFISPGYGVTGCGAA